MKTVPRTLQAPPALISTTIVCLGLQQSSHCVFCVCVATSRSAGPPHRRLSPDTTRLCISFPTHLSSTLYSLNLLVGPMGSYFLSHSPWTAGPRDWCVSTLLLTTAELFMGCLLSKNISAIISSAYVFMTYCQLTKAGSEQ